MGKIYVGQTALRIQLTVNSDIKNSTCIIKYKKPDGTASSWPATILNPDMGIIYYDIASNTDLDQAGDWALWAHVTFSDNSVAAGEPNQIEVYEEG